MPRPEFFIPGEYYFQVRFHDRNSNMPIIDTYIFKRKSIDKNGREFWHFLGPLSGAKIVNESDQESGPYNFMFDEDYISRILDTNEVTLYLHDLHKANCTNNPVLVNSTPKDGKLKTDFSSIDSEIEKFLSSQDLIGLVIGIQYEDHKGLSILKHKEELRWNFFVDWRKRGEKETAIRKIFENLNIKPSDDYLSGDGRIRSISYPLLNKNVTQIAGVCRKIFLEVYEVQENQTLKYKHITDKMIKN